MKKLAALTQVKLGRHKGIFTKSYYVARANYDSLIRNWEIELKDDLFHVKDSTGEIHKVYYEYRIQNCSCDAFVESQCGTCMHIETVKRSGLSPIKIRPLVFLNEEFKLKKIGIGDIKLFTPAYDSWVKMQKSLTIPFSTLKVDDPDVFTDKGITLFEFQKKSVRDLIYKRRAILALQMGLGKTLCSLAAIKIINPAKILIVAPNSLKLQWAKEIARLNLGSSLVILKPEHKKLIDNNKFIIISYEMLNRHQDILDQQFEVTVLDEIQKIKNGESKSWMTISKINTDYLFALSGTPIQNSITDMLSVISILNPNEFKPDWKFYNDYCNFTRAKLLGVKPESIPALRKRFERYIIDPPVTDFKLPNKIVNNISIALTPEQQLIHDEYIAQAKILIAKSMNVPLTWGEKAALNGLLTKARLSSIDGRLINPTVPESARMQAIQNKIKEITDSGKKVVVFSEWIKTLDLLTEFLDSNKISYLKFNGTLTPKIRDASITVFVGIPAVKVLLATDAGGQGVDGLQFVASNIIHVEPSWNPMKIEQRNGRLVRALQKEPDVNVFNFSSNSEVDKLIEDACTRKHSLISEVLK